MTQGLIQTDSLSLDQDAYSDAGQSYYGSQYWKSWSGNDRTDPDDLTPHDYFMRVTQSYTGRIHLPNGQIASPVSGYGRGVNPDLYWDDNDSLKLLTKLGGKIRSHDFNASIFLAEADQSLALIGETATRLAKFFSSLKKGQLYKAASFLAGGNELSRRTKMADAMRSHFKNKSAFDDRKALANAVLEVQYGWRPLLSDAYDLGEAAASLMSKPVQTTYKARRSLSGVKTTSYGPNVWTRTKKISQQLIATVSAPPTWQSQLRLNNFSQVVSNRTPWLFVANWFLPFEDYLEARSTVTDLNIIRLIRTTKIVDKAVFRDPYGTEANSTDFSFRREVLSTSNFNIASVPLPSFKPFKKSLVYEHVLNGIALLNGTVKRYRD